MGVARDKTLSDLISAVDTSNLLTDATGVQIKDAILAIASAIATNNTLVGLSDVDITNPTNGQTLVYDANTQKWINSTGGGGTSGTLTQLCYSANGYSAGVNITLSDNMTNYDLLQFNSIFSSSEGMPGVIIPVEVFKTYTTRYYVGYYPSMYADIVYIDNTTIQTLRTNNMLLQSVYGIKL